MHDLLHDQGAIFISIDDTELFRLGILMDQIFGQINRLPIIIWQKKYGKQNDCKTISNNHEYILAYAKNIKLIKINDLPRTPLMDKRYKNIDNDPRGPWKKADFSKIYTQQNYIYPITTPSGKITLPPQNRTWARKEETYLSLLKDNRIYFGKNGNAKPQLKLFLSEVRQGTVPSSLWTHEEVGHTDKARKELSQIIGPNQFDSVKPKELIARCIQLVANPDDAILDPFAGSGSTAHAVLHLNQQDQGLRSFTLIEKEAYCSSITKNRIDRLISGHWHDKIHNPLPSTYSFVNRTSYDEYRPPDDLEDDPRVKGAV
jgi:adenine-specific DNA-methyltransferase